METVKKYLKEIFIDGLSGMASGLFATLIIGTIIKQVGAKSGEDWAVDAFPDGIHEVSFAGSADDIQNNLDNAILEGLAHRKALIVRESGAVVKFGYKFEDLL